MRFNYTVTPFAGNGFAYCCCISLHISGNALKLNRVAFADMGKPSDAQAAVSLANTQRLQNANLLAPTGITGNAFDNAMTESINGLFKGGVYKKS